MSKKEQMLFTVLWMVIVILDMMRYKAEEEKRKGIIAATNRAAEMMRNWKPKVTFVTASPGDDPNT